MPKAHNAVESESVLICNMSYRHYAQWAYRMERHQIWERLWVGGLADAEKLASGNPHLRDALGLSAHTAEVLLHCFAHDVLVCPPFLGSQCAEPDVSLAVHLQGQGNRFFLLGLSSGRNSLLGHGAS